MPFWQNLILVLVGVIIASISYISKGFVFEPLKQFRGTQGKIRNRLKFFAGVLTSPGGTRQELMDEASHTCRQLSCDLEEHYYALPFRGILVNLKVIQPEKNIEKAAKQLIFLSNSVHNGDPLRNDDAIQTISSNLWFGKRI